MLAVSGETAHHITALWNEASHLEDVLSMMALGYAPHFTLAVYDAAHLDQLSGIAEHIAGEAVCIPVRISSFQIFDADPIVIRAAPESDGPLHHLQHSVQELVELDLYHEHYHPENDRTLQFGNCRQAGAAPGSFAIYRCGHKAV